MNIIFYWKKKHFKEEYADSPFKFYTWYPPVNGLSSGDTMWVVAKTGNQYVLVGKFVVKRTTNESNPKHGNFCIVTDRKKSKYYNLDDANQRHFRRFMKKLNLWSNDEVGVYFQGKRHIHELAPSQHQEIGVFSKSLYSCKR
jgi:hypothetical protein